MGVRRSTWRAKKAKSWAIMICKQAPTFGQLSAHHQSFFHLDASCSCPRLGRFDERLLESMMQILRSHISQVNRSHERAARMKTGKTSTSHVCLSVVEKKEAKTG